MPHTLLLADDSVTIQRVIELTFAEEDVQVFAVSDGEQAIAAVDQRAPDIVLADVGMPGRDGYEVAQHIKNTPRLAHIPVVLLTGAFEPIDQARAAAVGCDGVLAKPFEPQLVIGRVKELLARRGATSGRAESPKPAEPPSVPAFSPRLVNEEYFEELDQAFATLTGSPKVPAHDVAVEAASKEEINWFSRPAPQQPVPEAPVATPAPAAAAQSPAVRTGFRAWATRLRRCWRPSRRLRRPPQRRRCGPPPFRHRLPPAISSTKSRAACSIGCPIEPSGKRWPTSSRR